jgi:hypothetical protein
VLDEIWLPATLQGPDGRAMRFAGPMYACSSRVRRAHDRAEEKIRAVAAGASQAALLSRSAAAVVVRRLSYLRRQAGGAAACTAPIITTGTCSAECRAGLLRCNKIFAHFGHPRDNKDYPMTTPGAGFRNIHARRPALPPAGGAWCYPAPAQWRDPVPAAAIHVWLFDTS